MIYTFNVNMVDVLFYEIKEANGLIICKYIHIQIYILGLMHMTSMQLQTTYPHIESQLVVLHNTPVEKKQLTSNWGLIWW